MNHRSNWITLGLLWLVGLVGCGAPEFEGADMVEDALADVGTAEQAATYTLPPRYGTCNPGSCQGDVPQSPTNPGGTGVGGDCVHRDYPDSDGRNYGGPYCIVRGVKRLVWLDDGFGAAGFPSHQQVVSRAIVQLGLTLSTHSTGWDLHSTTNPFEWDVKIMWMARGASLPTGDIAATSCELTPEALPGSGWIRHCDKWRIYIDTDEVELYCSAKGMGPITTSTSTCALFARKIVAHELMHALGMGHTPYNSGDLMSSGMGGDPIGRANSWLSADQINALKGFLVQ